MVVVPAFRHGLLVCALALSGLAACAGPQSNLRIGMQPYAAAPGEPGAPVSGCRVRVDPVKDARTDAVGGLVGGRESLGVSMGTVEMDPPPAVVMTSVLKAELASMGCEIVESGQQFQVSAQLTRFQVKTPSTATYWDVDGDVELAVVATGQGESRYEARHSATCTDRTWVWPGEDVVQGVLTACIKDIGKRIRADAGLAGFLAGR
jgi:uncharacterized lipoprotein YajG